MRKIKTFSLLKSYYSFSYLKSLNHQRRSQLLNMKTFSTSELIQTNQNGSR